MSIRHLSEWPLDIDHLAEWPLHIGHLGNRRTFVCEPAERWTHVQEVHGSTRAHTNICSHKPAQPASRTFVQKTAAERVSLPSGGGDLHTQPPIDKSEGANPS